MSDVFKLLRKYIYSYLPDTVTILLNKAPEEIIGQVNEIRLRVDQPLTLVLANHDIWLNIMGQPTAKAAEAQVCTRADIQRSLQIMSRNSIYALEKELQQGYLTLAGGHRVGLAGQAIVEEGKVRTMKNISSLNIRIAREVKGSADKVMPFLITGSSIANTLIISPPRCGKTTVLRDIARQLSLGLPALQFAGVQVGVVDERSEIAACIDGVPSMDLGFRTDVLDGCPKAQGMLMLIRSMAPGAIITDELGRREDTEALQEALNAGVPVIASVHGRSVADILGRPFIGELVTNGWFERFIVLSKVPYPGTIEEISGGGKNGELLFSRNKDVKICG